MNDLETIRKRFPGNKLCIQRCRGKSHIKVLMATPSEKFPWAGLGIFMDGENKLSISG